MFAHKIRCKDSSPIGITTTAGPHASMAMPIISTVKPITILMSLFACWRVVIRGCCLCSGCLSFFKGLRIQGFKHKNHDASILMLFSLRESLTFGSCLFSILILFLQKLSIRSIGTGKMMWNFSRQRFPSMFVEISIVWLRLSANDCRSICQFLWCWNSPSAWMTLALLSRSAPLVLQWRAASQQKIYVLNLNCTDFYAQVLSAHR